MTRVTWYADFQLLILCVFRYSTAEVISEMAKLAHFMPTVIFYGVCMNFCIIFGLCGLHLNLNFLYITHL